MPRPPAPPAALMASPDDTEAQFYEALQTGDLERLMAVWADDEDVACVHPGGPRLVGHGAIRAAFEALFGHGAVDARPAQVRRLVTETTAIHHVLERVRVGGEDGPRDGFVLATNVYLKTPLGWRLALHHASPGSPHELQEIVDAPSTLH